MKFSTKVSAAEAIAADCVVVGLYSDGMTGSAKKLDRASGGAIAEAVASGEATGKAGSTVLLRNLKGVASPRVLLAGLGARHEAGDKVFIDAIRAAVRQAGGGVRTVAIAGWKVAGRDAAWQARTLVCAARDAAFRTDEMKSKKDDAPTAVEEIVWLLDEKDAHANHGLLQGNALANGMELTKRLGNLPANVCTPTYLGEVAMQIARDFKLEVEVLERKAIEQLKMASFLSVTRGSAEPPRLIVLKYTGTAKSKPPVVLVGKGITFDSGGISLKPGTAMDEMKFDMSGAGSVLGTLRAVAEMKLAVNVIGIVVACENLPSGTAIKPGDIVTSMSGQTIEILNTDAEGRLILCDALTYAERFNPAAVIDIATLTGACVVALGEVNTGLFSNDDALADQLLAASKAAVDPAWRMPVQEDYQDQLKSNFADMANLGQPGKAGAVVAACFLARFTKAYKWAHLDIAGTAWKGGPAKGATGRPVPLLVNFLMKRAK